MGMLVCGGAVIQCGFGQAPSVLSVLPANNVLNLLPAANITDNKPFVNITPFVMCSSLANPAVAAATAAAFGALTPAPCIPNTASPWVPGSASCLIGNQPALNDSSALNCAWGGVIEIKSAGQTQIQVP
ncbi:MAG: DUF4280 domain-containing protein [Oscillospiraceae bacterium]|jgi:hypothetical protein|nr:DUF4280 domain-containing protein [Oscillospiraceae bacterium]